MIRSRVSSLWPAAVLLLFAPALSLAQVVDTTLWVTNGPVHSILTLDDRVYVGGDFDFVGPATGAGVPLSAASGAPVVPYPKVTGEVHAVAADGAGGWYIGGAFSSVGGLPRAHLARVLADGSVAAWGPGVSGSTSTTPTAVHAIAVRGSVVYVGGSFANAGGQVRHNIAALDAASGLATAWDPSANFPVHALATGPATVHAGGFFGQVGGSSRAHIAALDSASGIATAWNPGADEAVFALLAKGPTVYAGGHFSQLGGQPRSRLGALDAATGAATAWNPGADAAVLALTSSASVIYVGGEFDVLRGQIRRHAGAVDVAGFHTGWNPNANGVVRSLQWSAAGIFAGGEFTGIGGQARNRIAALDPATGAALPWNPGAGDAVRALGLQGSALFAGGSFTSVGGQTRNNVAEIDGPSGTLTSWNPNANAAVRALAAGKSTLFAGGDFGSIGGQPRARIAELEISTGAATPWNPDSDGPVREIAVLGPRVYAAGDFLNIGGQLRVNAAALDAASGSALAWSPNPDFSVQALAVPGPGIVGLPGGRGAESAGSADTLVYAGGTFYNIGGQPRGSIAQLDGVTGLATSWNPNAGGWPNTVDALSAPSGQSVVYAGGFFSQIGGQPRQNIAVLRSDGLAFAWNPGANSIVQAILSEGRIIYVGGQFTVAGSKPRNHIAALDAAGDLAFAWDPNADHHVLALARGPEWVYAGGQFRSIGGHPQSFLARLSPFSLVDAPSRTRGVAAVLHCAPNPVAGGSAATLSFTLPRAGRVELSLFDGSGRCVARGIEDRGLDGGAHQARLGTRALGAGIYFARLAFDSGIAIAKVVVTR